MRFREFVFFFCVMLFFLLECWNLLERTLKKKKISFSAYEKRAVHTLEKIERTSHGAPLSANEIGGRKERERE